MTRIRIPPNHPRVKSLITREKLVERYLEGVVAVSGLIAHGRGEAFDYLLGEKTTEPASRAINAAAAALLAAENPVVSVNGNTAALVAKEIVELANAARASIEVNLFYRTGRRERAIEKLLESVGARQVLGVGRNASARISELCSERRRVDPRGIMKADVVLVPLEDGDRTEALIKLGKRVIAVDLNPLSRTAQNATITIVDDIVRTAPALVKAVLKLKKHGPQESKETLRNFDNKKNLAESLSLMNQNLSRFAEQTLHKQGRMM